MINNNKTYSCETTAGKEWKDTHPKGYQLVVKKCRQKLEKGENCIHLSALLFTLVRERKLKAPAGIGNSLATVIQKDYPEFVGKFHIKQDSSVAAEKAAVVRLLQSILEM